MFVTIMLGSVIKANKRYYPQILLEECKYKITRNKVENIYNDDLDSSLSDAFETEFDHLSDNGSDNDESNVNLLKVKTVFW